MRTADVLFVEVDKKENLPETLEVGVLYFVMNDGLIIVNHGVKKVEYPAANSADFGDFKGVWPVSKGGTGGTTPELARSSLGAMGFNDNAASATKLVTAFEVKLEGDVTGAALVDGSGDVILTTSLDAIGTNAFERIANKTAVIQNAAFADDIKYPTERAVRLELDAKADKSEIGGSFKGVFQNGTELVTAYPVGQLGWNATVLNTNTTWIWNGAAWADSGSLQAAAVQTVNGVPGPDVVLDIETNLNGYNKASVDTKVNTLNTAIGTKQDALTQAQLDTLNSVAGASTTDPLMKQSDVTNVQNTLQTNIDTVQSNLDTETSDRETADTTLDTKIDNAVTSLTNMVDGTALYTLAGNQLTNALGGTVALDVSLFPAGAELDVNRTLVTDEAGFMGVVIDTDTVPGQVTVKTVVTHSDNGGHIPVLLDNVQSYYDMPLLMSDATAMFSRTPVVDDYVRVVSDERHSGATVEYRVISTNTPVTVLLGVRENLVGNDPASLIPTVTAALAQGFIAPIVGDRYGLYTTTTPRTWTRYFVTAVDGDNITWGDAQVWDFKDGDDIPADFTVRPDLGWGSPLIINTSQYQAQTSVSMNGKLLTGGPVAGTFGQTMTARSIAIANRQTQGQINIYIPGKFAATVQQNILKNIGRFFFQSALDRDILMHIREASAACAVGSGISPMFKIALSAVNDYTNRHIVLNADGITEQNFTASFNLHSKAYTSTGIPKEAPNTPTKLNNCLVAGGGLEIDISRSNATAEDLSIIIAYELVERAGTGL